MQRFYFLLIVTISVLAQAASARADFDVSPRVEDGAIATYGYDDEAPPATALTPTPPRVFEFDMDDPGPNITSDPGFHALAVGSGFTPSGLPNGSWLSFNVLSNLQYWNGSSFVAAAPGNTLFLQLGGSFVSVTSVTGVQSGFLIGQVGGTFTPPNTFSAGDEGLHVHLQSSIVFAPTDTVPNPAGIYMVEMDLKLFEQDGVTPYPGISNSLPFWVIYDPDLSDPNDPVDAAVAFQNSVVPEPSACVLSALCGLVLIGIRIRARFSSFLTFAAVALISMWSVPARAVYDISPRLVTLPSGQQSLATYGYDDAGDNSLNTIYLTTNPNRIFSYFFGDFSDPYFDEDPGTHALATTSGYTPSNLPTGSWMSFDVMSDLQYYSGSGPVSFGNVPAGETLQMYLPGSLPGQKLGSVTIGTGTGIQPGFPIQNVDADGGMHKHMWTELQAGTNPTPADGIYLFEMRDKLLQSDAQTPYPGVAPSLPFFVLFDNNESLATYQAAQTWVTDNLVPFGDFNRDGQVNAADISAMLGALTNIGSYQAANNLTNFDLMAFGDINSDGQLNNADLQALLNLFTSDQYTLAPEPASLLLLASGTLGLVLFKRQR